MVLLTYILLLLGMDKKVDPFSSFILYYFCIGILLSQ